MASQPPAPIPAGSGTQQPSASRATVTTTSATTTRSSTATQTGTKVSWWPSWTGLGFYSNPPWARTQDLGFQRGKTLWDWLQLLVVPAILAIGGFLFTEQQQIQADRSNKAQHTSDLAVAAVQHQNDTELAVDQQREALLSTYFDRMSDLLLTAKPSLRQSKPGDAVRAIARARTLEVLSGLDPTRKGQLVQFLYEAGLIGTLRTVQTTTQKVPSVINLQGALTFSGPILSKDAPPIGGADLSGADLHFLRLSGAVLSQINLSGADLNGSDLIEAALSGTDLSGAHLRRTYLYRVNLRGANMRGADLSGAGLGGSDLTNADLTGASNQPMAHVSGVTWSNTICPDRTNSNNDGNTCVGHGF